jgi:phage gp29-like protein
VATTPVPGPMPLESPLAQRVAIEDQIGSSYKVRSDDPGFFPPTDPLQAGNVAARAKLVYRELPLITIQNSWTVAATRSALWGHTTGIFEFSAQLVDSIAADPRMHAVLGSRIGGLFGRPVKFRPANDSDAAKEVYDAWVENWPRIGSEASLREVHLWDIMMGWSAAQLVWDTTKPLWVPTLWPFHPRFTFYHWPLRKYLAITYDGLNAIIPGDGKWLLHAPYGEYRGWMRGAVRAVAQPWLLRNFALRDMGRYSEIHGLPTRVGDVPAASDPGERAQFESAISNLGANTSMIVPKGVDGVNGYDYRLVEAKDPTWEVFGGLIDQCDRDIALAVLFQNLTTEVKEGSFAAARVHSDVRQGALEADNRAMSHTVHCQLARPFAMVNFGDPDLAPWTTWDIPPVEDYEMQSKLFQAFGTAIEVLRRGGVEFQDVESLRKWAATQFGLDGLPDFTITTPVSGGGMGK